MSMRLYHLLSLLAEQRVTLQWLCLGQNDLDCDNIRRNIYSQRRLQISRKCNIDLSNIITEYKQNKLD